MDTRRVTAAIIAAVLCLAGCAEDTGSEWTTEVWPESTVQANFCTDMPHDDLDEPEVVRENDNEWAINYPVFREGCGAYQLTGRLEFFPKRDDESFYYYDLNVCNRCEKAHAIYSLDGPVNIGDNDVPASLKRLPESPKLEQVDSIDEEASPVVQHDGGNSTVKETPPCNGPRSGAVAQVIRHYVISYEEINRFEIEPDEVVSTTTTGSRYQFSGARLLALNEEKFDSSQLRWPRVLPLNDSVDGRFAASRLEYCAVHHDLGALIGNGSIRRAYEFPYEVDKKYVTQTVSTPTLPDALIERLEVGAGK